MRVAKPYRSLLIGASLALLLMCLIGVFAHGHGSGQSNTVVRGNQLSEGELFDQRYHTSRVSRVTASASVLPATEPGDSSVITKGRMALTFRAISLDRSTHDPSANQIVAREVLSEIRRSPLLDSSAGFAGKLSEEESPGTFTFTIAARIKKPLEL